MFRQITNSDLNIAYLHVGGKGLQIVENCVILEENAGTLIEKGKENQVSQSIEINNNIEAPIKKGDVLRKGCIFFKW